jgi:hypothetical protein
MTTLFVVVALAGSHADLPPARTLARDIAVAVGATVHKIAIATDTNLTAAERATVVAALVHSELFLLVDPVEATAAVELARTDPATVVARIVARDGEVLWSGRTAWPAAAAAAEPRATETTAGAAVAEEVIRQREQSEQQQLRVMPLVRQQTRLPALLGDDPAASKQWQGDPAARAARWGTGMPYGATARVHDDWSIVRGSGETLTEMQLAQALENRRLAERIETTRFWPRLFWVGGFALGAAAGVTSGAYLVQSDARDTRTVGVSLIAAGLVSGALALLYPSVGAGHVLQRAEAERFCDEYNTRLREQLGLTESDVSQLAGKEQPPSAGD